MGKSLKSNRNKNKNRTKSKSRTRKFLRMKGCAKKGSLKRQRQRGGCGSCLQPQTGGGRSKKLKGGQCLSCMMRGGDCGCGAKLPDFSKMLNLKGGSSALVGAPWSGSDMGSWGKSNHMALNPYKGDPQMTQIQERSNDTVPGAQGGGKRKRKGRTVKLRKLRGGASLIPQDLVNVGRNLSFQNGLSYNAMMGYPAPVNPLPYMDQMSKGVGSKLSF